MSATVVNGASAPVTTYTDGTGNPNQGSMIYAANSGSWWYFQVNSANDVAGNPGTHQVSAWYNTSGDPAAGSWVHYGESPNLNADGSSTCVFNGGSGGGRSVGCAYFNNSAGTNKDIAVFYGSLLNQTGSNPSFNGVIRAVLGGASLTWGNWGCYTTQSWNLVGGSTTIIPGNAVGITADGYAQLAGCVMHSELDCSVCTTVDAQADTWNEGNQSTTANTTLNSANVTNMSSQARLKTGMALSANTDWNTQRFPRITAIGSGTQVTVQSTATGSSTNGTCCYWQGTPGSNRTGGNGGTPVIDNSMTHECCAFAFAQLASNGMLLAYSDGGATNGQYTNWLSQKANQTQAQGFWNVDNAGTGKAVFSAPGTLQNNDACLCGVSTSAVYAACRTAATTCQVRNYVTGTDTWQAITNAPPTMTGKTIVSGGGVCLVSDGTDMWLLVIDSTDAQVKYVKYTHGGTNINGTWGSWTNLAAAAATASFLTAVVGNGFVCAAWTEKNGDATHYDTKTASLSVGTHAAPALGGYEDGVAAMIGHYW